jgi:methylisocitrate lyase
MPTRSPGLQLREAVAESTIQIPGAFCALVGRMAEQAGYPAVYLSGAALSAGVLAAPDVGLFDLSELAAQTRYLARRVTIPVLVDADTGFGSPANVERTVVELEAAGAAAIQIEDQAHPKRCGHLSGKTLVDAEEMCARLRAAVTARADSGLVLLARTDAAGVEGIESAIDRARRYLDAGADWIFPEALTEPAHFEEFARAVEAPLVANMTEFGKSPLLTLDELAEMGYVAAIYPVTMLRVAMRAVEAALTVLAADGSQRDLVEMMQTREELYELIGYQEWRGESEE